MAPPPCVRPCGHHIRRVCDHVGRFPRRDAPKGVRHVTEAIAVALVSGLMTPLGVLVSNSRSRTVMEVKIDELRRQVEKYNSLIERTYRLEQDVAVLRNDVESIRGRD